jgi:DNA-binding beta-propeller fold protein YncE
MKGTRNLKWSLGFLAAFMLCESAAFAQATPTYSVVAQIPGSGGAWDYATIDEDTGRLYLAQRGVTVLDLKSNDLTTGLLAGGVTHGVIPLGAGKVAVTDSESKTVKLFDGASGKVLADIPTAQYDPISGRHTLDALVWEPKTGLIVAVNGESGILLLIDEKQSRVIGSIPLGGKPEFAAADGAGNVYVNVNEGDVNEIIAADISAKRVTRHMPLSGCEDPTGLAYDQNDRLLISVCGNGLAKFVQADNGREVASLSVSKGADAVMFDPNHRLAFVPGAADGTLSVIAVDGPRDIRVIQTLTTQKGARLGAVDSKTGRVYLPIANFGTPVAPSPYPSVIAGTFRILVVAPN